MKKRQLILGLVVIAVLLGLAVWGRNRIHFDFGVFRTQVAMADWRLIAAGVGCIYLGFVLRAARWACLIRYQKKVSALSLVSCQVLGFTAVALIGRVADPVRPYLVSKKTDLELSTQFAVYIVERLFDLGTLALVFSVAMLWVPTEEIVKVMPHSGPMAQLGAHHAFLSSLIARYSGLILTLLGALFLVIVRVGSNSVASFCEHSIGLVSKSLGQAIGHKIRAFRTGLSAIHSLQDLAAVMGLSLGMWALIALAYFLSCRAFVAAPQLASITPQRSVLVLVASGGASILQLPVIGWFTQIGLVAIVLSVALGVGHEAATACAATLLLVTFLSIVPVGLIWAQFEHVSLRKVTAESEHAGEEVASDAAPEPAESGS